MKNRRRSLTLHRRGSLFRKIRKTVGWLALLLALTLGLVVRVIYQRADSAISGVVAKTLAKQFPQAKVEFDSVRLDSTYGLRLFNVQWKELNAAKSSTPLLMADEIYIECPLEIKKLVSGQFEIRRVVVNHPTLRIKGDLRNLSSQLQTLHPANLDSPSPNLVVEINNADLVLDDATISKINVNLTPSGSIDSAPIIETKLNEPLFDASTSSDNQTSSSSLEDLRHVANYASENSERSSSTNLKATDWLVDAEEPNASIGFASYKPALTNDVELVRHLTNEPQQPEEELLTPLASTDETSGSESSIDVDSSNLWNITIAISNPYVEDLTATGTISFNSWNVDGSVVNLDLATLAPLLKKFFPKKLAILTGIQGKTSLRFSVENENGLLEETQLQVDGELKGAAISSPHLKYPVSEIEAEYRIEERLFEVRRLVARCGQTSIKAAYRQVGSPNVPSNATMRVQLNALTLTDADLVKIANSAKSTVTTGALDSLLNFLEDYHFAGIGNFDFSLEKNEANGDTWELKNLSVAGRNIEFLCVGFPYRLDSLAGNISIDQNGSFTFLLDSEKEAFPAKIQGRFINIFTHPRGQVDALVLNRPIDSQVFQAVNSESRQTLETIHPSGFANARVRITYDPDRSPESDRLSVEAAIDIKNGAIQYDSFPMPISSISGTIYIRDGVWTLPSVTGKSGGATFAAAGSLVSGAGYAALGRKFDSGNAGSDLNIPDPVVVDDSVANQFPLLAENSPAPIEEFTAIPTIAGAPLADESWRFLLAINTRKFPLGEELRDALLIDSVREPLERINLEGKANGQIRIGYRTDEKRIALQFDASPLRGSTSFTPEGFPFPLADVEGQVSWREGKLSITGLRARNGNTTLSANVTSQTLPNVGSVWNIDQLRIDQLQINRDLKGITTVSGQEFINFLQPSGFFNIDGGIRVTRAATLGSKYKYAWNLRLIAQQNSVRPGTPIAAICGRVQTYGIAMEGTSPLVFGEFDIDSLFYKDAQITNLVGPFYYNGSNVFWGKRAPNIRRTPLYLDPFIRQHIDANPLYQTALNNNILLRSQNDEPAGFNSPSTLPSAAPATSPLMDSSQSVADANSDYSTSENEEGTRSFHARLFDGQASCDGIFIGGETPRYRFTANLQNAALEETTRVISPGSKPLKGRVGVNATIQGEGKNIASLKGEGSVVVREAQLYELPQIVKILQILSVQEPGENAFSSCDVDFKVLGDHIQLSRVFLEGDALTLFGDGWLTISEQERLIDLTLNSRLGNSKSQIPIVSDVLGAAGDQVAQIRVEGNLASPIIQQDRLPGLKKAWWSLFPEQEPTPNEKAPVERSRPVRDVWRKFIGTEDKKE